MNINLVAGFNHLAKYEFVNGKDDTPYIVELKKTTNVPNHQPDINGIFMTFGFV